MTDNLPAVPEPAKAPEIQRTDTDSWVTVMRPTIALAEQIAHTEFVPKSLRTVPAVTAAILYGREVGLPPMTALVNTHVIEGKPSMSAEAMRAMVVSQGHELIFDEATGAQCRMRARRRESQHWTELAWTIDMARAAGLLGKSNWKSYPRAMLIARCTADLCRMVFPDVILGFRSVEEMTDLGAEELEAPAEPTTTGSTRVGRKPRKTAAAKTAQAPTSPAPAAQAPQGPPLPGEEGHDAPEATPTAPEPPDRESDADEAEGKGGDVVDMRTGEIVEGEIVVEDPPDQAADPVEDATSGTRPVAGRKASGAQQRMILASLAERGVDNNDREERLHIVGTLAGRPIDSSDDLRSHEASRVIDLIAKTDNRSELNALLDQLEAGTYTEDES